MTDLRISRPSLPGTEDRTTLPGRAPGGLPPIAWEAPPPAATFEAVRIGFAMARARLLRRPMVITGFLGAALVVVAGIIERRVGSAGAVDRALAATFNLVVPLVAFALMTEASGRDRLRDAMWPAARHGVARRDVALGAIAASATAAAALSALYAVLTVAVAHGPGNPPIATDALTSAWVAALAAAAYTGWFAIGSTFGRRGRGRWAPLVLDFTVGASTGLVGALLPRANAASLLGGAAPLGLPQGTSSLILAASAVVLTGLAALRCRE
ncbi:MAG: hypothetical protein QM820_24560 [Minicystis sp.]